MSIHSLAIKTQGVPARWGARLMLLFIIACFAVPLAVAWWLVGRWTPGGTVQHGELLHPARALTALRFMPLNQEGPDGTVVNGHWVLVYAGSAGECAATCQTALYNLRQVRLALGKDMQRVQTLLLLDESPVAELRQWLADEHATMIVSVTDAAARAELSGAFNRAGKLGDWIYLLDPLGNLVMRYPVAGEPRGMLKDLQRLLRLSRIG